MQTSDKEFISMIEIRFKDVEPNDFTYNDCGEITGPNCRGDPHDFIQLVLSYIQRYEDEDQPGGLIYRLLCMANSMGKPLN